MVFLRRKSSRLVTTLAALSRENLQIAETPLMQMTRINTVGSYVLYKQTRVQIPKLDVAGSLNLRKRLRPEPMATQFDIHQCDSTGQTADPVNRTSYRHS
jgi:hypothetical protein